MDERRNVLWQSLVLTLLIFAGGMLLNHFFDFFRISTINDVMLEHELDREAYTVEHFFAEEFGGETCEVMTTRIADFKEEIRQVGEDLGSYSRYSFFRRKDYDYLKRKYFLLELRFFAMVKRANLECGKHYLPVLFFYEIDDDDSERQGFILQDLSKEYERELVVLSLDLDYEDEPLLETFVNSYNISSGPALVIDDQVYKGLLYTGELNSTIRYFLRRPDPYAVDVDFNLVTTAAGSNVSRIIEELEVIVKNESADSWARGDASLVIFRLNGSSVCPSMNFFDSFDSADSEKLALKFETIASLGCGRNRAAFLRAAAKEWRKAGVGFRADILEKLAEGRRLNLKFDSKAVDAKEVVISGYHSPLTPVLPKSADAVVIGNTSIRVSAHSTLVSQEDRVFRDWLGAQINSPWGPGYLKVFSERLYYNKSELRPDIGWHEGARVSELVGVNHIPAVGTLVARRGDRWFAVDDRGVFRFEVPIDKVFYPTTRFLRRDLAVIIDTHGVNMIVEQAIRHNADAVLSDCDHPGKVYAAKYLSDKNISVICFPDKYVFTAIGHNLSLVGSPPQTVDWSRGWPAMVYGNRPLTINAGDSVVAVNASDNAYALWYYQTPTSYFQQIAKVVPLNVTYVSFDDFGQMGKAVSAARFANASVLATRVFSREDYLSVRSWLASDPERKAILFHSASYPYGQLLFKEFINQTSFDDPNPVWLNET